MQNRLIVGASLVAAGGAALAASVPMREQVQDDVESWGSIEPVRGGLALHNALVVGGYISIGAGAAAMGSMWLGATPSSVAWGFSW